MLQLKNCETAIVSRFIHYTKET